MSTRRKPKLGQNFLVDDRARQAIVDALGDISRRTVIEIGPGQGALTDLLARRAGNVLAIELDRQLAPALAARYADKPRVRVLEADILTTDLPALVPPGETVDVVGNLPYYITSDILLALFAAGQRGVLRQAVLMMQREVAERVTAGPGSRDYGMLSATTAINASVEHLFTLPPGAFRPQPEVESSVVRLHFQPRFAELGVEPAPFTAWLRASFAQKRKTLANNLRAAGYSADAVADAWPAELPSGVRAEAVQLETSAAMFRTLSGRRQP